MDYVNDIKEAVFIPRQTGAAYRLAIAIDKPQSALLHQLQVKEALTWPTSASETFSILVGEFTANPSQESTMIRWMHRFFLRLKAFPIYLNNISVMPPHQLFVRILCTQEVKQLRTQLNQLNQYLSDYELPTVQQPTRWMLPILPSFSGMNEDLAMHHFSQMDIAMEIAVTKLQLIKQHSPAQPWQMVQSFPFQTPSIPLRPWYEAASTQYHPIA